MSTDQVEAPTDEAELALRVAELRVRFAGRPPIVNGVSFEIKPGERTGLIGESGSGKSVTALAIMGLLPDSAVAAGEIEVAGRPVLGQSDAALSRMRGSRMSMIFQEPMTALDPTMRVGRQVAEVIRLHAVDRPGRPEQLRASGPHPTRTKVLDLLSQLGLEAPERIARAYPHELSGGQRQRVMVAMALANTPDLIICDEPTTALDVTAQARVLELLDSGLRQADASCLFISHDLAVVAQLCQQVIVMLDGEIVEQGELSEIVHRPQHPYTQGLVAAARIDQIEPGQRLPTVADFTE